MRRFSLTLIALLAFAANSVLCRMALATNEIDAASFTLIRLLSGALVLSLLLLSSKSFSIKSITKIGSWESAFALFVYAAAFSFAYQYLDTATGALILFACVQITMITIGLFNGSQPTRKEWAGMSLAIIGFVYLLLPGLQAPSAIGAVLMAFSGVAWGVYSVRGAQSKNPMKDTTGNFVRSLPFMLLLLPALYVSEQASNSGYLYAVLSGAFTSGLGYAVWYYVLPELRSTVASITQLSVPIFAGFGGVILLNEVLSARLLVSAIIILGGITLVITAKKSHSN